MSTVDFENDLNSSKPIAVDLSFNSPNMLIACGGIYGAMGIPPFEFFQATKFLPINKIYLRDPFQCWYHYGLPGIADDLSGIAQYLNSILDSHGINKCVLIGNSMGGFAAILFGILLNAQVVHAFSPQTFIDQFSRWRFSDRRWQKQINKIYLLKSKKILNLKKKLAKKNYDGIFNIYYSLADPLDVIHAKQVEKCKNIQLYSYQTGGHNLIKSLRDAGELSDLIQRSF